MGKVFYPYPTRCISGIRPDSTHGWVFVPVSISGGYETRGYPYPRVQLPSLFGTWRGFDLLFCVLEWSLELLYWMQWLKTWMPWSVVVGGVFIAPTTKMAVGEAVCRWAHLTVRCATGHCPVRQPRHPTVRVRPLELWQLGPPDSPVVHWTVTVHCPVRLLTLLWLCTHCPRTVAFIVHFAYDRWRSSHCFAWHTRQSGATPDILVNYSGVALQKPEAEQFRVDLPGAPGTVRWHTG
jgi:hypothetical protein